MNPHPKWKQSRCKLCAAGVPLRGGYRDGHNLEGAPPCTAPEPEDYIAELEAAHGYCQDCKHWQAPGDLIGTTGSTTEGFGQCGLSEFEANDIGDRLAIGECYEFGTIRCKANYGCVQFEGK